MATLSDWNVVVTVLADGFADAMRLLPQFGAVGKTRYWDVLVMRVEQDPRAFLDRVQAHIEEDATLANAVARLVPVTETFTYQTPEEFRGRATDALLPWAADLNGGTFHVRMHRRGLKGRLSSHTEERALGDCLLESVRRAGGTARVAFDQPDWIIAIETVDTRAGLSRWSRGDLDRYELLGLD